VTAETLARSLNRLGIDRFRSYLSQLRGGASPSVPHELLDDSAYSNELPVDIVIEERQFSDRKMLGRYLTECLSRLSAEVTDRDTGLWAWLSLLYWDHVCPVNNDGSRRPGRDYRHIPEFGYRHRHRHLMFGPFQIYRRHGELSALLLTGPLFSENRLYHEIASRQDFIANKGVLEAAMALYFDPKRGRPKPGAQASHRHPGSVRRFVRVLQQLDVTYDIYGLAGTQILELLPEEFDFWKPHQSTTLARIPERASDWPKDTSENSDRI